ncbi:MAG: hypothetical protein AAB863_03105 [Patescibacteria group bacterium]
MRHLYTKKFLKELYSFPVGIQRKFEKQLRFLLKEIRYPSLRVKKIDEIRNIWQGRVDDSVRFYFTIDGDVYVFHGIKKHSD